jgi:fatty-acyl-CoA synthase
MTRLRLYVRALRSLWRSGLLRVWPWTAFRIWRSWRRCRGSLAFLAEVAAVRAGSRLALVDDDGPVTFADLRARYLGFTAELVERFSAGPGRQIAIVGRNHRSVVAALLAATRTGADVLLLNPDSPAKVLDRVLTSCTESDRLPIILHSADIDLSEVMPDAPRLALGPELGAGAPERALPRLEQPGHLCVLTAGSTGVPKRVRRKPTIGVLLPTVLGLLDSLPIAMYRPTVLALPIFHGHGLATLAAALAFASPLHFGRRHEIAPLLARTPTPARPVVVSVPTLLARWLAAGPPAQKIAAVLTGSAPLTPQLCRALVSALGPTVYNLYGSTEAGVVSLATPDMLASAPGTVGKPFPSTEVRIVDTDGRGVSPLRTGRIQVRGPLVSHPREIEWLDTGDLGRFDEAGRLHLCGRADGMIISGGENVYPQEIETRVLEHPDVAEVAIAAVTDAEFGARMRALVVVRPESHLSPEVLRAWLHQRLDRHQRPKSIEIVAELPHNVLGKIDRTAIARMVEEASPCPLPRS